MPAPFWPWEINARLHGPQRPAKVAARLIGELLLVFLVGFIGAVWVGMMP